MREELENLAQPGFMPDPPSLADHPRAWTDSRNVRYRDGAAEKVRGYTQALGDLSATAMFAVPVTDGTNYFWMYGSNAVMYATDGSQHANVTGSITLGATDDLGFTGGAFHGHIIVTDGASIPQSWVPSLANDLVSLTAWPAVTLIAKVVRPFKDFIFALRITDNGTYNPRVLRWSDRAAQGALPLSWDFSDPTNQAGINELGQTPDQLVDAVPLRDSLVIYKEFHTWIAQYSGLPDVFSFRQVFSQLGMLTENCAVTFGSNQVVLSDNDLVIHDGNNAKSLADKRTRRWLFNRINAARFKRCFVVADHRNRTVKVCFPESGVDWPNLALCWDWAEDTFHVEELGGPKTYATTGIIPGTAVSFDADTGTFAEAAGTFDEETYSPFLTRILLLDSTAKRAYQDDSGEDFNGSPMTCYAEHRGLSFSHDLLFQKRIKRIFPKVAGAQGDILRFYIGARSRQNEATSWTGPYDFTIGVDYKIDLRRTARLLDFKVEYVGTNSFRLHTIGFEYEADGLR
jgi:hypothetical protein